MSDGEIVWDAAGLQRSGRGFRMLSDEQSQVHEDLRAQGGGAAPVPYPEFAGPLQDFLTAVFDGSAELVADYGATGDGQNLMASRSTDVEAANEVIASHGV
ncbi:hypothetical protein [Nonomuraea sp. NPDC049695]|uniref:hypothetical protein n=1 Tax=Nonomuraea sp. NPDC049695 TaxID=3154734 RepID=UPI0034479D03